MRLSSFLLVATAVLLSNCNATAASGKEDQVMTSADAAVPVRALEATNGKRSLRYYDEDNEDDKYDQKNGKYDKDEDGEERSVMTAEQIAKWTAKANEWVALKKTPASIKDKLTAQNGVMSDKNTRSTTYSRLHGRRESTGARQTLGANWQEVFQLKIPLILFPPHLVYAVFLFCFVFFGWTRNSLR
ncbi:hypothetical protein P3T76_002170 [Phytophthora citrophthora]|uniref:RxLR effector protein n=1 Tax=Phytophthora citrophthora TaxID=4793 RepID=A0AAD9GYJ3_9STRA|nr:hypothetical protein P3T76_002170 [Phytophthora citrophthora]